MKKNYLKTYALLLSFLSVNLTTAQTCVTTITAATSTGPICNGSTATLTATHDGDNVYWYNSATNGTLLHTGTPFETPALTATTSFWVESRKQIAGTQSSGGGKPTKTSTSGTAVVAGTSPWGLVFNASQTFILNSVDVFVTSGTAGSLVINLKNSNSDILQSWTIATPGGGTTTNPIQFTVPLNYLIPVGTGYRLVAVSSPTMIRDTGTNAYPFSIGTVGSVTQGTINNSLTSNSGVYYFFYNWNYTPVTLCSSARTEVAVTVNTTSQPTGDPVQLFTTGETVADLSATGTNLVWYSDLAGTIQIPTTTLLVDGTTYYVRQTVDGCSSIPFGITAVTSLGIETTVFSNLKYYPNPVKNTFFLSNLENKASIAIYNLLGQQIFYKNYDSQEAAIDFSNFDTGTYFLKITSNQHAKTIKVIKN